MRWNDIKCYKDDWHKSKFTNFDIFDEWSKGKNITKWISGRNQDFPKLIRTGRDTGVYELSKTVKPPQLDHVSVFKRTDEELKVWLTYQPYTEKEDIEEDVLSWAHEHDLHAEVFEKSKSWYAPNESCLVVITTK